MTTATIETDKGTIEIELKASAPKAVANFVELARKGFYDGVVFHRLVPGFVIQGGDGEYGHIDKLDRGVPAIRRSLPIASPLVRPADRGSRVWRRR